MSTASAYDRIGSFELPGPLTSLDKFRAWADSEHFPQHGKVTYYAGRVLFDMSPERYESHSSLKREITYGIERVVRGSDLGDLYIDGSWFTHDEADVSNEPDVMFATWETLAEGRLEPAPDQNDEKYTQLVGTPDWVCEIISDSSERKDDVVLREAYFRAGVPEYWLIDARGAEIDFKLLVAGEQGYEEATHRDGWRRSPVFACEFHLSRERNRVGRWLYKLAYR